MDSSIVNRRAHDWKTKKQSVWLFMPERSTNLFFFLFWLEGKGKDGKGKDGKGMEVKGRDVKGWEGKGREGMGRERMG
jgi:hypothetical protein